MAESVGCLPIWNPERSEGDVSAGGARRTKRRVTSCIDQTMRRHPATGIEAPLPAMLDCFDRARPRGRKRLPAERGRYAARRPLTQGGSPPFVN
ncbi:hypothetical protein BGLA2_1700038 [Burkholderia gladioli]|nr:hypothetical protein BGLA2_1700038 [Burkholderia gladioli]